jgi:hypothetical protein
MIDSDALRGRVIAQAHAAVVWGGCLSEEPGMYLIDPHRVVRGECY